MSTATRTFICDTLSCIVIGVAVAGMAGLAIDYDPLISWGRGPGMALPTAFCLVSLAVIRLLRG